MNVLLDRKRFPDEPRLVAFGGGGGGVGRSTLVSEVARLLVRRGKRVLVVDADVTSPTQHHRFDIDIAAQLPGRDPFREDGPFHNVIVPGDRTRPALLSIALTRTRAFHRIELRATRLVRALRETHFEYILLDLPGGFDPVWSTVFVLSDVPVALMTAEAMSITATTRYLRAAVVYATLIHPDAESAEYELLRAVEGLPLEADIEAMRRAFASPRLRAILDSTLDRFQPYVALSMARDAAERDLPGAVALHWARLLDVWPRVLGAIEFDERRWFQVRHEQRTAASEAAAAEGSSDGLVKAILDIDALDAAQPRRRRSIATAPCDRLGVAPDTEAVQLRQTYRRLWETFRRDSPFTTTVLSSPQREAVLTDLEDTHRDLLRWLVERPATDDAPAAVATPPRRAHPGDVIRGTRTDRGLSLRELSLQTKIGLRYLEAIEQFEVDELPRPVYLRGYLREIALALELAPDGLMDDYLTALSEARTSKVLSHSGAILRDRQ